MLSEINRQIPLKYLALRTDIPGDNKRPAFATLERLTRLTAL
jgi:hypothetical protein